VTAHRRVVVATGNPHKLSEIAAILDPGAVGLELVPMSAFGIEPPVEDGADFAANALIKARACVLASGLPALADDSGLEVDALDGAPGVRSARFAGEPTDDAANNRLLLERIAALGASGADQPRAAFVCAAALVLPDGAEDIVEGRMTGSIVAAPRGAHGFGYDPLFVADASADGRTNAELLPHEKDALSHRGVAFRALRPILLRRLDAVSPR
jgi:XTP/dITP diphosphohydrolase